MTPSVPRTHRPADPSGSTFQAWVRDIIISFAIAAIVIVFLYQPVKVEGTSMMPRLVDQQRIFVNKFVYRFEEIQRGDIIVFRFPLDSSKSYIKRVVGLPGDDVEIARGELIVNGDHIPEPYVLEQYSDRRSHPSVRVEPGHYYVLGDRRKHVERQSHLGNRGTQFDHWKSCIRLLAAGAFWGAAVSFPAILALEDGRQFHGIGVGAKAESYGEVVFNTGITGYQEIFTDPSYCGQIVILTNPEIGNYGANGSDSESARPYIEGLVVREFSEIASNWRSSETRSRFLGQAEDPHHC